MLAFLCVASPAAANGVTFPIAAGTAGPYDYEVGVGAFSPLRRDLFVAVTLMTGGYPVVDADVMLTASVDGFSNRVGPVEALNSLDHPPTYEVSVVLVRTAREWVNLTIEVDGSHGPALIEARMMVPAPTDALGTGESLGNAALGRLPQRTDDEREAGLSTGIVVAISLAAAAGSASLVAASWVFLRHRRRPPA